MDIAATKARSAIIVIKKRLCTRVHSVEVVVNNQQTHFTRVRPVNRNTIENYS